MEFIKRNYSAWFRAKYRQALRNLPQQKGFPFAVEFPVKPREEGQG